MTNTTARSSLRNTSKCTGLYRNQMERPFCTLALKTGLFQFHWYSWEGNGISIVIPERKRLYSVESDKTKCRSSISAVVLNLMRTLKREITDQTVNPRLHTHCA